MRCEACGEELRYFSNCPRCGAPRPAPTGGPVIERNLSFHGEAGELFPILVRCVLLSIVTLGIYSFWARAEIRRYLIAHLELDGDRFQYHGTGRELFMGFLRVLPVLLLILFPFAIFVLEDRPLVSTLALLAFYFVAAVFTPAILALAWRYRVARTSWRGIRFSWRGSLREIYREALVGGLIAATTLGIAYPVLQARMRTVLIGNTYFGNLRFQYDEDGNDLIGPRLLAGFLTYPTLGIYWFWYWAREQHQIVESTHIGASRFWSSLTGGELFRVGVVNGLMVVASLGLAWPVAAVRSWRLRASTISLRGSADLDTIVQEARPVAAAGEMLGEALPMDVAGLDLGL